MLGAAAVPSISQRSVGRTEGWEPSMRNLLDESSVAQGLDGAPSIGEPAFPRTHVSHSGPPSQEARDQLHHSLKGRRRCAARRISNASWTASMMATTAIVIAGRSN